MTDNEYENIKLTLSNREKADYEKLILEVPPAEVDWLIGTLLMARSRSNREATPIHFKICDKCERTFPYYTLNCDRCSSPDLRDFQVRHNHNDLLDYTKR